MKMPHDPHAEPDDEFKQLVHRLLDDEADLDDLARLNQRLPEDHVAMRYFVKMRMLHTRLSGHYGASETCLSTIDGRGGTDPLEGPWQPPRSGALKRSIPIGWLAAAAVLLLGMVVWVLWGPREAAGAGFKVVARHAMPDGKGPPLGRPIRPGERIVIPSGMLGLKSPGGSELTVQGPAEMRIGTRGEIELESGKLWLALQGAPILVHTPSAILRNLGTTYGIDQNKSGELRVDVKDGRVSLGDPDQPARSVFAGTKQGFTRRLGQWPPEHRPADFSEHAAGLRTPVGLVFGTDEDDGMRIQREFPHGARWVMAGEAVGEASAPGASFTFAWAGSHFFSGGASESAEAALFHTHLVGAWFEPEDLDRSRQAASAHGLDLGESGQVVLELRGMKRWLKDIGARSYRVTVFRNSVLDGVRFLPVTAADATSGPVRPLATVDTRVDDHLPAGHPDHAAGTGARAVNRFSQTFAADTLRLTLPAQDLEDSLDRNNLAACLVTPVL